MAPELVSVCICTFQRPELLARLLASLDGQERSPAFTFEVVVVDNDHARSAEAAVRSFREETELEVRYDCEPEQNIALARNRAVRNARGSLVAFIDDDEHAAGDWLVRLHQALIQFGADGVLGPVLPEFPADAPVWLKKSKLLERRRLQTGMQIINDKRTGNVLLRRSIIVDDEIWFDPARGRTGGEDGDFFSRQMQRGRVFVWCDDAIAYETVSEDRWKASFHLKKYLRIGSLAGQRHRRAGALGAVSKSVLALGGFSLLLPVSLLAGKGIWMRVLTRVAYNVACVSSFWGLPLLKERD